MSGTMTVPHRKNGFNVLARTFKAKQSLFCDVIISTSAYKVKPEV